jgi:flagellar protein FlaG
MISNISQIISMPVSSTRELNSQNPSSTAATAVAADPAQNAVTTDKVDIAQAAGANNSQQAVGGTKVLAAAVDYLNSNIQTLNRNLEFSIDQQSGTVLVKVVDAATHELIRQIPSEEALALARNIQRYMLDHHVGLVQAKA